jgi:tetratricopeptide (TPR) repeat protein
MLERLMLTGAAIVLTIAGGGVARCADGAANLPGVISPTQQASQKKDPEPVDETALRYYASLKQTSRVEAETRRLSRLNPNWRPPADLWTSRPGNADEGPLWDLFSANRLDELRKAIEERRVRDPGWTPSTDLAQKLLRKEMRAKILAGKNAGRWAEVATAAEQGRFEGDTSDVEVLWDISDAYARTKRPADAMRVLTSILKARSDTKERIATVQKAIAVLPMADAERLIVMANIDPSDGEFAALGIDITRARISAFLHDEPANEVAQAELGRFKDYARTATDPNQPGLVAWYALKRNDLRDALEWFKSSIAQGGDATIAHGLAHTLRKLGQLREAEEVAYAWREPSAANAILFIDILADQLIQPVPLQFEAKRITRYAEVTLQTGSGEGAQALAWYAYNSCQFDVAVDWFRHAVAWFPKEASVFGYALTLRRLKRHQEFVEIVNRYDGLFPKVLMLLFPEGRNQQASPCDVITTAKVARAPQRVSEFLDLRPAGPPDDALLRIADKRLPVVQAALPRRASIPKPLNVSTNMSDDVPLVKRSDFPIPVSPENPLRYSSAGQSAAIPATAAEWRERDAFANVTVARRVPGVGPMPYERFGMTLLRGWNGSDQPNYLPALELRAPVGTLWQSEQAASSAFVDSPARTAIDRTRGAASRDAAIASDASLAPRFHP